MDWAGIEADLNAHGCAVIPELLKRSDCLALRDLYLPGDLFRSRIVMARHGFGKGEYKYFRYPLPEKVAELRTELYPHLAGIANRWSEMLGAEERYPSEHAGYLQRCHEAGQTNPTPLLLAYTAGDY